MRIINKSKYPISVVHDPKDSIEISNNEVTVMPYKSKAQEKYFNANKAKLEKQGVDVSEWNQSSKGKKLPNKVKKKGKKK